jgi:hypothetical protein
MLDPTRRQQIAKHRRAIVSLGAEAALHAEWLKGFAYGVAACAGALAAWVWWPSC